MIPIYVQVYLDSVNGMKANMELEEKEMNLKEILDDHLDNYEKHVIIDDEFMRTKIDIPTLHQSKRQLKRLRKEEKKKWNSHGLPLASKVREDDELEQLKMDYETIQMRQHLFPDKYYKSADRPEMPNYFQTGTVVDRPTDMFNERIPKKERCQTLTEEILKHSERTEQFHEKRSDELRRKERGKEMRLTKLKERLKKH
ncbi:hypothetical protein SNEBB_011014 [Seison nebaliae]|nr:hypothetical protein SNEBB_011014 [Seison nebaliae]